MTNILFIYHGNICRSVMAEYIFKSKDSIDSESFLGYTSLVFKSSSLRDKKIFSSSYNDESQKVCDLISEFSKSYVNEKNELVVTSINNMSEKLRTEIEDAKKEVEDSEKKINDNIKFINDKKDELNSILEIYPNNPELLYQLFI